MKCSAVCDAVRIVWCERAERGPARTLSREWTDDERVRGAGTRLVSGGGRVEHLLVNDVESLDLKRHARGSYASLAALAILLLCGCANVLPTIGPSRDRKSVV